MSESYFLHEKKISGDIAIVGMATHFPDAPDLYQFWQNIIGKKDSLTDITEMPEAEYWKKDHFYHPDPAAADKTYGHRAGFVPAIDFDPVEFKIPPAILDSLSTTQLFALYVAKQAMQDAGLLEPKNSHVDRDRIGVILGGGGNGNTSFSLAARQQTPYLREIMLKAGLAAKEADEIIERAHGMYLEWNEDSFPGFLGNVACGRIASYFDLGGTSYMVDAACASSLAAIKAAIGELHSGSCDAVLTGGVNLENSIFSFLCFSKTPALSKNNVSRPFDQRADGMMLGDGVGMLVLKRLEDAELDGDRIYAVIKAVEASSDGRAKSIFAPRLEGQVKALKRAYDRAGVVPGDIRLVEAHGTGTASGDDTELKSLHAVFSEHSLAPKSVAIGSIKSQIGHTRCAAGAAAMIKVALALHHKVLPPTINVEQPTELLRSETSPFYVNTQARPWLRSLSNAPRRAALSAFGFGGTNFHAILEEYEKETHGRYRLNESPWIVLFKDETPAQLLAQCEAALSRFTDDLPENGVLKNKSAAEKAILQHLAQQDIHGLQPHQARVLFVAQSTQQVVELLAIAVRQLQQNSARSCDGRVCEDRVCEDRFCEDRGWEHPRGIYFQPAGKALAGKIVALFPGQGSQYVNMARDIANDYPEMRQSLEALDDVALHQLGHELSPVIYPVPAFSAEEQGRQQQRLTDTANAQPALGAVSAGYFNILKAMGFRPDFVAGHSYGEVTALWAAGVLSEKDFYRVSLARGLAAASASQPDVGQIGDERIGDKQFDAGAMLAASLAGAQRESVLQRYPGVIIANDNSEQQVVFGGATAHIYRLHDELKKQGIYCRILPVSAAFHTQLIEPAYPPYHAFLSDIRFRSPDCTLFSSATAEPYVHEPQAIRSALAEQLIKPVKFRQMIENLYRQGGRLFVEFGPKGVLGKLVSEILQGREHSMVSICNTSAKPSDKGEERLQFARAQARLLAEGIRLQDIHRHARIPPVEEDKGQRLTFRLSGGFFLSEKNKARRQHALRDGSPIIQKRDKPMEQTNPITKNTHADTLNNLAVNESSLNNVSLNNLLQAQQVMSQQHLQFQANQKEYIQLLGMLLEKQYGLLDNCKDHQNLPAMLSSLSQSVQLLDKNLELYHSNHERYFAAQQSLFQSGQRAPVFVPAQVNAQVKVKAPEPVFTAAPVKTPVAVSVPNVQPSSIQPSSIQPSNIQPIEIPSPMVAESMEAIIEEAAISRPPVVPELEAELAPKSVPAPKTTVLDPETEKLIKRLELISEANIISQLIAIVSDRTGYPPEMISAEMDLEADLGIDSIKRLEIFGAMFDAFSANLGLYSETSRNKDLDNFEVDSLSTIARMSGFFRQMVEEAIHSLSAGAEAVPTPNVSPVKPPAAAHSDPSGKLQTLGFVTSTSATEGTSGKKPLASLN
ncbi:MAG: acyltransferase domain-containing protein [Enterobacteriaceae bacterium]|jgi:polyketide-type polyunsaturated fatty acid synthase PfaA|nr:acyltransferase domain-containing protein [Enterobacteriaceae bacterium]